MSESALGYASLTLPSQGIWYGGKLPDGKVAIRRSTMREDLILDSPTLPMAERLNRLITACTQFPAGFTVGDLLLTDRMVLALGIRSLTYGANYTFSYSCAACRAENKTAVNFATDLVERTPAILAEENPELSLDEPFTLTLPISGQVVALRHLRVKDDEEIEKTVKTNKLLQAQDLASAGIDSSPLVQLIHRIVAVDGKEIPFSKKMEFALEMHGKDNRAISRFLDKFETGVRMVIERKCKACAMSQKVGVPLTLQVFRSDSDSE